VINSRKVIFLWEFLFIKDDLTKCVTYFQREGFPAIEFSDSLLVLYRPSLGDLCITAIFPWCGVKLKFQSSKYSIYSCGWNFRLPCLTKKCRILQRSLLFILSEKMVIFIYLKYDSFVKSRNLLHLWSILGFIFRLAKLQELGLTPSNNLQFLTPSSTWIFFQNCSMSLAKWLFTSSSKYDNLVKS